MSKIISVKNLKKLYQSGESTLEVIKGISLDVEEGEILVIIGESGSGKSTFLNLIGGLDRPTEGKIVIQGMDITDMAEEDLTAIRNKTMGFVFQFHNLLLDFTACENVMLPYLARNFHWNAAKKKALELLDDVVLKNRAEHKPGE